MYSLVADVFYQSFYVDFCIGLWHMKKLMDKQHLENNEVVLVSARLATYCIMGLAFLLMPDCVRFVTEFHKHTNPFQCHFARVV